MCARSDPFLRHVAKPRWKHLSDDAKFGRQKREFLYAHAHSTDSMKALEVDLGRHALPHAQSPQQIGCINTISALENIHEGARRKHITDRHSKIAESMVNAQDEAWDKH